MLYIPRRQLSDLVFSVRTKSYPWTENVGWTLMVDFAFVSIMQKKKEI